MFISQTALRWLSGIHHRAPARLFLATFPRWMLMARSPSKTIPISLPGTPTSAGGPSNILSPVFAVFLLLSSLIISSYLVYQRTIVSPRPFVAETSESTPAPFLEHEITIRETALVYKSNPSKALSKPWCILTAGLTAAWLIYGIVSLSSHSGIPALSPLSPDALPRSPSY
jgi:hypothetical protein